MIKNIFIPEQFGTHYIFPKRIVGIDIGRTQVHATQLYLKGTAITVEKNIATPLEVNTGNNFQERASNGIAITLKQLDTFDELRSAFPSSLAIFKELKLPFIGHDKIAMVIAFELEPLIPFPLADAIIDFIITKEHPEEKSSEVLVCAVQKTHIIQHLQLFEAAGVNPNKIIVDFFALYGLYKQIPSYASLTGTVGLIDLGSQSTRIGLITNGQLRLIRTLNKGIVTLAKNLSDSTHIPLQESMEEIIRFGLERYDTPAYTHAVTSSLLQLTNDISFTFNSLASLAEQYQSIEKIIIVGGGAEIKGITNFITNTLSIPCELFNVTELFHNAHVTTSHKNGISVSGVMSLATALPSPITDDFNLKKEEFDTSGKENLLSKQLITAGILITILLSSLALFSFFQTRKLAKEAQASEQEVITELSDRFPRALEGATDLEEAVEQARQEARKEEQFWFSFANPNRVSFLAYLLELTSRIDQKSLGFVLDKLVITENLITMTGHVRDHEALYLLEKSLSESKLFASIEKQQNPQFASMKIKLARPM